MGKTDRDFHVPGRKIPVIARPDVCVVGGGAAGLSAAVGAARCGLKVLLLERYGFCGGATVAGLSGSICGLFSSGDRPRQIVFGFAGEFHAALKRSGGAGRPVPFGRTLLVPHDSLAWKEAADRFLKEAGIEVLYHTVFLDAFASANGKVSTLTAQCREGTVAIQPGCVVDASGDAEVVHSLGGKTSFGAEGVVQTPTMVFRMGGVDMRRFLRVDPREIDRKVSECDKAGRYRLPRHHVYAFPMPNGHEVLCNMTRISFPDGSVPSGIKSGDLTYAEMEGRVQARAYAQFLRDNIDGFAKAYMVDTGTQVGIRQSRSIVGNVRLTNEQVMRAAKAPGAASFSAWPIEAHGPQSVKIVYLDNQTYDIPFETLVPVHSANLIVAGRCLCAEHEALASARVTAQCFGMGYAAGAACALMVREKVKSQSLDGPLVARWMKKNRLKTASER